MAPTEPAFNFRIPADLRADLTKEAEAKRQSLNAYLLTLLETHPDRKKKGKK